MDPTALKLLACLASLHAGDIAGCIPVIEQLIQEHGGSAQVEFTDDDDVQPYAWDEESCYADDPCSYN